MPVCLANAAIASFLMDNAKEIFCASDPGHGQLLVCVAMVGQTKGLGLDIPAAYVGRIEASMVELASWIRTTCIAGHNGVDNVYTQLFVQFEGLLKSQADLGHELKQSNQTSHISMLMGSAEDFKRAAHSEVRMPSVASTVDWTAALTPGAIDVFVKSVRRTVYENGGTSSMYRLLEAIFGPYLASEPDAVHTGKGCKNAAWGAVPSFEVFCNTAMASTQVRNWDWVYAGAVAEDATSESGILACKRVFSIADKVTRSSLELTYAIDMGESFVPDVLIFKLVEEFRVAAANASADKDADKAAKVTKISLAVDTDARNTSRLYFNTIGEIGTAARSGGIVDGRGYKIYEAPTELRMVSVYVFVADIEDNATARFDLGSILAKKISRPASSFTAFADRAQRAIRIESAVAFTVSEEVLKAVISLGTCVPGTTNSANAAIAISKQETDALMLDQSTSTVYVAASLPVLKDMLNKSGIEYNEARRPGVNGNSGASNSEITALRQQMLTEALEASARQARNEEAVADLLTKSDQVAEANREEMEKLRGATEALNGNLQTVYKSFDRAQRQNALAAEITADKHERAQSDMVRLMEKLINDNTNTQAVMRSLLTSAPQLALAVARDTVLNLAEAAPTDQGGAPGGDGAEAMAAVSTLTEQLESTAKRGRNDDEDVGDTLQEEELAVREDELAKATELARLAGMAARTAMDVEEGAPVGWNSGSTLGGRTSSGYYNYNGSTLHGRQLIRSGGARGEGEYDHYFDAADWITMAAMCWLIVLAVSRVRRLHRMLGRGYASVHKARRKKRLEVSQVGKGMAMGTSVVGLLLTTIAFMSLIFHIATPVRAAAHTANSVVVVANGEGGIGNLLDRGAATAKFGNLVLETTFVQTSRNLDLAAGNLRRPLVRYDHDAWHGVASERYGWGLGLLGECARAGRGGSRGRTRRVDRTSQVDAVAIPPHLRREAHRGAAVDGGAVEGCGCPRQTWRRDHAGLTGDGEVHLGVPFDGPTPEDYRFAQEGGAGDCTWHGSPDGGRGALARGPVRGGGWHMDSGGVRQIERGEAGSGDRPGGLDAFIHFQSGVWSGRRGAESEGGRATVHARAGQMLRLQLGRPAPRRGRRHTLIDGEADEERRWGGPCTLEGWWVLACLTIGIATRCGSLSRQSVGGSRIRCRIVGGKGGWEWALWLFVVFCISGASAGGEGGQERTMLFNTRGLAVSTVAVAAGAGLYFASAAKRKLAFIAAQIEEKKLDAGVLLELICSVKQSRLLRDWFRARGFGLKVLAGDARDGQGMVRNGVAIFYRRGAFTPVTGEAVHKYRRCANDSSPNAAARIGSRMLRLVLRRADWSVLNLIAWHGKHDEAGFMEQMEVVDDVIEAGCPALILGDVNRRACPQQSSRSAVLGAGDRRWRECVRFVCPCCSSVHSTGESGSRLVPILDEKREAATRRADVSGVAQWAVLDRALEVGHETGRWRLEEIVWAEVAGDTAASISDHAAVCYERPLLHEVDEAEGRTALPKMKAWGERHHRQYARLTEGAADRAEEAAGGDPAKKMEMMDAELVDAAETVEYQRTRGGGQGAGSECDNRGLGKLWRWRLDRLQDIRLSKHLVTELAWITHPRCTLRHDAKHHRWACSSPETTWSALVRRCRKEVHFFVSVCDSDRRAAVQLAERVARAESETDPLKRVQLAHSVMRGQRGPQDKLASVAIGDDPENGFVHRPSDVRKEAANVGRLAQEEYKNDNPAPDLAFEAFMEHFMEEYDEVESPDGGGAFDLSKLLTYELFNDQLLRYARYKSVGAKVGGAVSSLELIRRLSGKERRAYFDVAKQCIVGKKTPGHWAEMVFVLLKKKHGDQRKIRKMREIALMDQTLKLMLKCVKKLSFDRCVGRTGEENHGWVPGHGALNAALMMDAILGQARELKHSIFILFLDLKQFFPAIKRESRKAAEYFIGLPEEVILLATEVFAKMKARFDTAHGLSEDFDILTGDLMGCVLSPSHARCLLTAISVAIAAVSSGVRVWGCERAARHVAQTMMADDWAGFNTTEESLQAQWGVWMDYAMATGSPIGVAGLEKTVVTAATYREGKWVDVTVKLRVCRGEGGLCDLPEFIPQMPFQEAYPHMGILRSIGGDRGHMMKKIRRGVLCLVSRLRKIKFDRGQHIACANGLKGSYVGYYSAASGLTMKEADEVERLWRTAFRGIFKIRHNTPVAHFYGGQPNRVADSLHGRHVIVDAVGALYSTCRRALASPEDSSERAIARSALARRARKWGCTTSPCGWLGSDAHVAAAVVMEKEMEARGARPEAFDFFLLYTAWLEVQDRAIHRERVEEGREPSRRRPVIAVEHEETKWGEALMASEHSAWTNGTSKTLYDVLGVAAPASLVSVGITRVEHLCRPGDMGGGAFEFTPFAALAKTWGLSSGHKVRVEWGKLVLELRERCLDTSPWFDEGMGNRVAVRPLSARQLWDGVRRLGGAGEVDAGWPLGEAKVGHRRGNKFTELLLQARSSGEDVSKASWREALVETYGLVERLPAAEWRDGAPTDVDRYGSRIINVWPVADSRTGEGVRVYGGRSIETGIDEGREGREEEVREWSVDESGDLMIGSRMATLVDARGLPCVRLLMRSTARLKEEGAAVDAGHERTLRGAGVWAIHVESSRQILREWNGLYVEHDIQYAAATDGGRQVDDKGRHVASSAGVLDNGCVVGGALDPHKDARSSYETELQALIDVLEVWPDGSRVMIAVDARSPVQAIVRFREAHVNRRAEYFADDKLDSLLRHLERMQTVVFYWLKGHSGAAPNEFADLHATKFLSEDVPALRTIPVRRHASMTFAFDRKPFQWAAVRIGRHVREMARAKSSRSEWLGAGDWDLRWQKVSNGAELQRVLQGAQTKRLLLGDEARYEGGQAVRASGVLCKCGGGPCSTAHWFFDCTLPVAVVHRGLLLRKVRETGRVLELSDGGREHGPTVITALALQRAGALGVRERRVAFRWLVGCIPRPLVSTTEAKACAMEALRLGASGLRQARTVYGEAQELFIEAERSRGLGLKYGRVWMARSSLSGPLAWKSGHSIHCAIQGPLPSCGRGKHVVARLTWRQRSDILLGRVPRCMADEAHWQVAAREWLAVITILRALGRKLRRWVSLILLSKQYIACVARSGDSEARDRKRAGVKRALEKARVVEGKRRQAAHFEVLMGLEGSGNITLAEGLEDVDVNFRRRRRVNWSRPGGSIRRPARHFKGTGRRRRNSGRREEGEWVSGSDSSDSGGDGASEDDGESESLMGDDGSSDEGSPTVKVHDHIRIWWSDERVWFRCEITEVLEGGKRVEVEYVVKGWQRFVHRLSDIRWERWSEGGEVDVNEQSYDMDEWTGPLDIEARDFASRASARGGRGVGSSSGGGQCDTSARGDAPVSEGSTRSDGGELDDVEEEIEDMWDTGRVEGQYGSFDWAKGRIRRGKGAKKRKELVGVMVKEWDKCQAAGARPGVGVRELYKLMARSKMTSTAVKAELKGLSQDGVVVISEDVVWCGTPADGSTGSTSGVLRDGTASDGVAVSGTEGGCTEQGSSVATGTAAGLRSEVLGKRRMRGAEEVLGADRVTRSRSAPGLAAREYNESESGESDEEQ